MIEIRLGRVTTIYRCRAMPTDFGSDYRGFELQKLGGSLEPTGVVYHVLLDLCRGWHRCDCLGHEAHGHCKHSDALAALCRSARRLATGARMKDSRQTWSLADVGLEPGIQIGRAGEIEQRLA
jgi:hypothetical protein